jgi:hypothetical protein
MACAQAAWTPFDRSHIYHFSGFLSILLNQYACSPVPRMQPALR